MRYYSVCEYQSKKKKTAVFFFCTSLCENGIVLSSMHSQACVTLVVFQCLPFHYMRTVHMNFICRASVRVNFTSISPFYWITFVLYRKKRSSWEPFKITFGLTWKNCEKWITFIQWNVLLKVIILIIKWINLYLFLP